VANCHHTSLVRKSQWFFFDSNRLFCCLACKENGLDGIEVEWMDLHFGIGFILRAPCIQFIVYYKLPKWSVLPGKEMGVYTSSDLYCSRRLSGKVGSANIT